MRKTISILQSNYLPWKGYFDIIAASDVFVFLDNVQYTKNDWRNRNRIKTTNGVKWLTVPCGRGVNRNICDVDIVNNQWQKKHFKTICQAYSKAPYFEEFVDFLKEVYLDKNWHSLSELNQFIIKRIAKEFLSINTEFKTSGILPDALGNNQRLVEIIKKHGGSHYLSGPAAGGYLDTQFFNYSGIEIDWMDYSNYPE